MKENNTLQKVNQIPPINERVLHLLKSKGVSGYRLEKDNTGIKQTQISHLKSGRNKASDDLVKSLLKYFTDVNRVWLLTGEGNMLKDNTAGRDIIAGDGNVTGDLGNNATINIDNSGFSKELSDAQQMNVTLMGEKIDYLERKIKKGEVELKDVLSLNIGKGKPYYNIDFINGFSSVEDIVHENPEYNIDYPPANQCEFWVNTTGESMRGVIDNGDKIALKAVDKEWFPLGEIYAIVTTNGYRMIKKITKSEDKDCYKLVSANPDKEAFPDQDIPKEMIQSLFKVVVAIKFIN